MNSLGLSKILYYAAATSIPPHYVTLLQRSAFRFVWNSKYEPVSRNTLYLDFLEGGLNVPNFKLKCEALHISHLQKLINNYEAKWTYFAKYWLGMQLRNFNPSFANNSIPHSEYIPPFYKMCLSSFKNIVDIITDISFTNTQTRTFYKILLNEVVDRPKIEKLFPQVTFKSVWKNTYLSCIDPDVRNTY